MRMTAMAALLGAGLLVGAADRADRAAYAAPIPGGKVESCVLLQNIRDTRVIDDRTIDFNMRNGDILRNELPMRCPQLGFERAFSYSTSISQLCSVDIITVLRQNAGIQRGASCGLGKFTPVAKVAKAR